MPKRSQHQGSMTAEQFDAVLAAANRMRPDLANACRAVLVDGHNITATAQRNRYTKQALAKALERLDPLRVPEGWERRWVMLPHDDMTTVIAMENAARRRLQGQED